MHFINSRKHEKVKKMRLKSDKYRKNYNFVIFRKHFSIINFSKLIEYKFKIISKIYNDVIY